MKKFIVYLWCGSGYCLTPFECKANNEYQALDVVTAKLVNHNKEEFFEELDSEVIRELWDEPWNDPDCDPEGWMYVDATMEGASRPVYVRTENMRIETV